MTEHDKRIVEAAEAWFAKAPPEYRDRFHAEACAIFDAVAAKREAERPKLLTAEKAHAIYLDGPAQGRGDMQAALDACLDRAMRVIEALPVENISHMGSPVVHWVKRDDIRRALRPGAAS